MNIDSYARIIWDYMRLNQKLKKVNAIFVFGSIDERVAEYAAQLFLDGYGDWLIVSGGTAHEDDMLSTSWTGTEAEHFGGIAKKMGVPSKKIILESKATNTGENIMFTYNIIQEKDLDINSILLVQKPYMERRAFATFEKQWPDSSTQFHITSPPLSYSSYFNKLQPKEKIVNLMVGDLQRIKKYPALGYQTTQEIPDDVWAAYGHLVSAGFTKHLIK